MGWELGGGQGRKPLRGGEARRMRKSQPQRRERSAGRKAINIPA